MITIDADYLELATRYYADGYLAGMEHYKNENAVDPRIITIPGDARPFYRCGHCGMTLVGNANYCHNCGKKVNWNWEV